MNKTYDLEYKKIGLNIAYYRKLNGLTQLQLAELANLSRTHISYIEGTGTKIINVSTNPADATVTATSETTGVATATATGNAITITGVTAGSAIVEITATKDGFASFKRTVLVIVK